MDTNQAHDKANTEAQPEVSASGKHPKLFGGMSVRTKGIGLMILFLIYTLFAGLIMARERNILYQDLQQLEAVHAEEERQFALNMLVTRAILVVNDNYYAVNENNLPGLKASVRTVAIQTNTVLNNLLRASQFYPVLSNNIVALQANLEDLTSKPASRKAIGRVRDSLHVLVINLEQVTSEMRKRKQVLLEQYHKAFDSISLIWSFTAAVGIVFIGSLVMIFVTRLAWDIRRVQDRALAIIEGYRGKPLKVTRRDELGSLMNAVNKMQLELRHNEMQMELIRQQRFHKEKMAAVGSLAAVVAHELNNPLAAIVGAAQAMIDQRIAHGCADRRAACHPDMILDQARRVMNITRQISAFSTPQSTEPELLDINSLIRSTANFISFDRRFGTIEMVLNLDPQLPAVHAVGDHITQMIINLLVNAADALEGRTNPKPRIVISTCLRDAHAVVTVADNGMGMNKNTLGRVFEEYFTTKPPGKGSGIGLAVSKSLIESDGGDISIESELGAGTTVTVQLPLSRDDLTVMANSRSI